MKVYFVGAGPGDPELLTVKGQRLLTEADVIIYAGSLVNPALLKLAKPGCSIYNSASMTLEEVIAVTRDAMAAGRMVVRLHTGDPSIYGAIREQMDELDRLNIEYCVVPGVSSFLAAAAALKKEYTLPDVSQTVIITRGAGRTEVPEKEQLRSLAAHRATMCIFLSVQMIDEVVRELLEGYTPATPVAVVEKASWPEERVVSGTLADIAGKVADAGITKTAMIVVGDVLDGDYARSRLYHPEFSHGYRSGSGASD